MHTVTQYVEWNFKPECEISKYTFEQLNNQLKENESCQTDEQKFLYTEAYTNLTYRNNLGITTDQEWKDFLEGNRNDNDFVVRGKVYDIDGEEYEVRDVFISKTNYTDGTIIEHKEPAIVRVDNEEIITPYRLKGIKIGQLKQLIGKIKN